MGRKLENLDEIKKQYDFNKTEPEVIIDLVADANKKGEKIRQRNAEIQEKAYKILNRLSENKKIIYSESDVEYLYFENCTSIGIDGSFFPIGGVGGQWYVPYAIVRILFNHGINQQPIVDVFEAGIEEIKEQEHINVSGEASKRMLIGETRALEDWGFKKIKSLIFIDGPIVDPPAYNDFKYIEYRANVVKSCIENSKLIGCVKRSRDTFFLKYFEKLLKIDGLKNHFPSDQHLFSYFFTHYRFKNNYEGMLFSNVLDLSHNETYRIYKEYGISICSIFFQKSMESTILRLDLPFIDNKTDMQQLALEGAKAASNWQYPHQYIPLPVELAHEKCKIREGAAETIYDEILTKSRTGSPESIMTMLQLR